MFVRTCLGAAYSRSLVQVQPYLEDRRRVVRAKLCFELRPPPPPPLRCCCCCRGHRSFRGCFDEAGQKKRRSYSASSFSISEKATFASPGITKIKVSCKKTGTTTRGRRSFSLFYLRSRTVDIRAACEGRDDINEKFSIFLLPCPSPMGNTKYNLRKHLIAFLV